MAGTIEAGILIGRAAFIVSMESGLDGRNNLVVEGTSLHEEETVSMESGLDGRNN